jgi:hypothetical protein
MSNLSDTLKNKAATVAIMIAVPVGALWNTACFSEKNKNDTAEKPVAETKDKSELNEFQNLKDSALPKFSASSKNVLTSEQRLAVFEEYKETPANRERLLKTSAGTAVRIRRYEDFKDDIGSGYSLHFEENTKNGILFHYYRYDNEGSFKFLSVRYGNFLEQIEKYDSSNKWAVKRGDSFITDIQKANPKQ